MKIVNRFFLIVIALILLSVPESNAQVYNSAIGLRVGYPLSITYKKNTSDTRAYEIFGGIRPFTGYNELRISGAVQIHSDLNDSGNFRWYYGVGGGAAVYNFDGNSPINSGTSLTISGYLGLEFTLQDLPLNFTLDWVPTIYIGGFGRGFGGGYGALAIRYVL